MELNYSSLTEYKTTQWATIHHTSPLAVNTASCWTPTNDFILII